MNEPHRCRMHRIYQLPALPDNCTFRAHIMCVLHPTPVPGPFRRSTGQGQGVTVLIMYSKSYHNNTSRIFPSQLLRQYRSFFICVICALCTNTPNIQPFIFKKRAWNRHRKCCKINCVNHFRQKLHEYDTFPFPVSDLIIFLTF